MRKLFWLFLIFGIALLLRLLWLGTLPATFFVDEVLSGYLGRYLWANGTDLYGNPYPLLYFNKFGDYYIILPMWLDGLSTFIFGVTRFATRFPTAVIGALAVFPLFGIARRTFGKPVVGYLAALLLAITPWHVVLSRATTESVIELTLLLTMVWMLLKSNEGKRTWQWLVGAVSISLLSYLVYHTARVVVPLLWLGYASIFIPKSLPLKRLSLITVVCTIGFFLLTFGIGKTDWGTGRFSQTSIFGQQSPAMPRMAEQTANLGPNNVLLARIFNNKIVGFGREFINQYAEYFSTTYLFTDHGWAFTRYAVPQVGLLYLAVVGMLAAYVVPTSQKKWSINQKLLVFIFWWLLIAPLPASLTVVESPNIRRSLPLLVPLLVLAAGGWYASWFAVWKKLPKISLGHLIAVLLLGEAIYFGYAYVKQSDLVNALWRTDVLPQVTDYIIANYDSADAFYVTNSIDYPLYYLFARQDFSPEWSQKFGYGLRIDAMDKVRPVTQRCVEEIPQLAAHPARSIYFEPDWCGEDNRLLQVVGEIHGVNSGNKYRILKNFSE